MSWYDDFKDYHGEIKDINKEAKHVEEELEKLRKEYDGIYWDGYTCSAVGEMIVEIEKLMKQARESIDSLLYDLEQLKEEYKEDDDDIPWVPFI